MSNWIHVAGIIRADSVRTSEEFPPDFDEIVGREVLWRELREKGKDAREHPDEYLPMGSEGSLRKTVWINPDNSCADTYTISIFGDLRNRDSNTAIIDWFKKLCKKFWIRQAVITVNNEHKTETWTYTREDGIK